MRPLVDRRGRVFGHHRLQFLQRRLLNRFQALEMLQQRQPPDLSHPRNTVQRGPPYRLSVALPVEGDGEPVGLLLNAPDEGEHHLSPLNTNLPALRRHQRPGPVPVVLHHAEDGDRQPEPFRHPPGHLGVLLAAVDEHHVRQRHKLFILLHIMSEPPGQDLLHGPVIVRMPLHILDPEPPVPVLGGPRPMKHHHGRHDIVRAGV